MIKNSFHKLIAGAENIRTKRTILAVLLTFFLALVIALVNEMDLFSAVRGAAILSLFAGAIVAVLAWAVDLAKQKGYSGILGFVIVLLFNVIGILFLLWLPRKNS